jgi:ATP:corrinoid adenosyltransferase
MVKMAEMFPAVLLDADVKSDAERRVFGLLRDGLGHDWSVFHSASVVLRDHALGSTDDECDFVLCHAEHGVVALEVKGGPLECRHGQWLRKGERIKDPFQQALDHAYNLRRKLGDDKRWHIVHALAFTDLTIHTLVLAPDAPAEIVWDRHDLDDIEAALERTLAYHRGSRDKRRPPDPDHVRAMLAPEFRLEVSMGAEFVDEEEALITLTVEQAKLLGQRWRTPRMAVYGCAGSGKTTLAVERAKRLARAGQDVAFVCFNKGLAAYLKHRERHDRVDYVTFHSLCLREAKHGGVDLPDYGKDPPQEYWRYELPAALMEAGAAKYDALIVDEAQDLHTDWLDALTTVLRDPEHGSVWLFLDDNQRVYDAELQIPPEFQHYDLTVNCRNTQAIHDEVMKYYAGQVEFEAYGPPGRPVVRYDADDEAAALVVTLDFLVNQEEILPQDIVVLSSHAPERSAVARQSALDGVRFSSIRSFKGLEAPVVVLVETDELDEQTRDQQLYVAISRAKNHCVILSG